MTTPLELARDVIAKFEADAREHGGLYETDASLLAREVVRQHEALQAMERVNFEEFVKYKQRRNEQFAAYDRQRHATIAYLLDRAEQYDNSSGYRALFYELVGDIAEWRHVTNADAGEYDDMKSRVDRIIASHAPNTTPRDKEASK